jgi:hypothetical protein
MMKTDRQMKKWIEENAALTLDQLTLEDATIWHKMAEDDTWNFLRYSAYALSVRRKLFQLRQPISKREINAFQLEFRIKIQMVIDQLEGFPPVPLYDFGGATLFRSKPFMLSRVMYLGQGGAA